MMTRELSLEDCGKNMNIDPVCLMTDARLLPEQLALDNLVLYFSDRESHRFGISVFGLFRAVRWDGARQRSFAGQLVRRLVKQLNRREVCIQPYFNGMPLLLEIVLDPAFSDPVESKERRYARESSHIGYRWLYRQAFETGAVHALFDDKNPVHASHDQRFTEIVRGYDNRSLLIGYSRMRAFVDRLLEVGMSHGEMYQRFTHLISSPRVQVDMALIYEYAAVLERCELSHWGRSMLALIRRYRLPSGAHMEANAKVIQRVVSVLNALGNSVPNEYAKSLFVSILARNMHASQLTVKQLKVLIEGSAPAWQFGDLHENDQLILRAVIATAYGRVLKLNLFHKAYEFGSLAQSECGLTLWRFAEVCKLAKELQWRR